MDSSTPSQPTSGSYNYSEDHATSASNYVSETSESKDRSKVRGKHLPAITQSSKETKTQFQKQIQCVLNTKTKEKLANAGIDNLKNVNTLIHGQSKSTGIFKKITACFHKMTDSIKKLNRFWKGVACVGLAVGAFMAIGLAVKTACCAAFVIPCILLIGLCSYGIYKSVQRRVVCRGNEINEKLSDVRHNYEKRTILPAWEKMKSTIDNPWIKGHISEEKAGRCLEMIFRRQRLEPEDQDYPQSYVDEVERIKKNFLGEPSRKCSKSQESSETQEDSENLDSNKQLLKDYIDAQLLLVFGKEEGQVKAMKSDLKDIKAEEDIKSKEGKLSRLVPDRFRGLRRRNTRIYEALKKDREEPTRTTPEQKLKAAKSYQKMVNYINDLNDHYAKAIFNSVHEEDSRKDMDDRLFKKCHIYKKLEGADNFQDLDPDEIKNCLKTLADYQFISKIESTKEFFKSLEPKSDRTEELLHRAEELSDEIIEEKELEDFGFDPGEKPLF